MSTAARLSALAGLLSFAFLHSAHANKDLPSTSPLEIGHSFDYSLTPDLKQAQRAPAGYRWSKRIIQPDAQFIKVHFSSFNLHKGDSLTLINGNGAIVETLTGRGPKNRVNFWSLSSPGDSLLFKFEFQRPYAQNPFRVDRIIIGDAVNKKFEPDAAHRSVCFPADFSDAICYQDEPGKWSNVQASVGIMSVGGNPDAGAIWCSGTNVSPLNYVLTNHHCIGSQLSCDNSEFVFRYYRTGCNNGSPTTMDWQSFRCDTLVSSQPLASCEVTPTTLDFSLNSVIGDPASTFGFVQWDSNPPVSGEEVYIVQHPSFRPHEITQGSGADFVVDGHNLRYYGTLDTESGSSGSPIFRSSNDKLIGLHHCGGCNSPSVGNRGMLMQDIGPLIQPFLCSPAVDLVYDNIQVGSEIAGNGDSYFDPGESWSFNVDVVNLACSNDANSVTGTVALNAAVTDAISIVNPTLNYGTVAAGARATQSFTIDIPTDAVCTNDIIFDLTNLTAAGAGPFANEIAALSIVMGGEQYMVTYNEDFDAGLSGWSVIDGGVGTGPASTWTTSNPGGRTPALVPPFMIADSDELGNGGTMDEQLISDPIDTSAFSSLTLQFTHEFRWYVGGLDEQADVHVRSSATGGSWVLLQNYSGEDASGTEQFDISIFSAPDLQIRFHYYNAEYEWWWAVDDVVLIGDNGLECNVFGDPDTDGDGVPDSADNCTLEANASQLDTNGDGYGNACDPDLDNNGVVNFLDSSVFSGLFGAGTGDGDFNGDGNTNFLDYAIFPDYFGGPPGPSGVAP